MTDHEPEHVAPVTDAPTFLQRARKAVAGGVAGLAAGGLGTAISAAISDGQVTSGEVWQIAALAVGGFALGFGAVFAAPANAPKR